MAPTLPMQSQKSKYFPIREISAYQSKWVICARVTDKSQLRTFNRKVGGQAGKVFTLTLLDEEGSEIRANFFNDAVDKHHDKLEVGKCYSMSKGNVRIANKQYNPTNHRYELTFDNAGAEVELVEDNIGIESVKFNFVDLLDVQKRPLPSVVDVCGVVTSFEPSQSLTGKTGQALVKRDIVVADSTETSLGITLWGERATQKDSMFEGNPVIALKSIAIREWNGGRSGSILQSGVMQFDPDIPEAKRMKSWWIDGGSKKEFEALSKKTVPGMSGKPAPAGAACTFEGLRLEMESLSQQPQIFNIACGRLNQVQLKKQGEVQPLSYMSCQEPKEGNGLPCNRRVDEAGYCPSCNRTGKVAPRMTARCRFSDYTSACWLTTFHQPAQQALTMNVEEVQKLEVSDRERLDATIASKYFLHPVQITVRAKLDSYQGETRPNAVCVDVRPINLKEHGRALLKEIQAMVAA